MSQVASFEYANSAILTLPLLLTQDQKRNGNPLLFSQEKRKERMFGTWS